jgi:hypothetical protein
MERIHPQLHSIVTHTFQSPTLNTRQTPTTPDAPNTLQLNSPSLTQINNNARCVWFKTNLLHQKFVFLEHWVSHHKFWKKNQRNHVGALQPHALEQIFILAHNPERLHA